MKKNTIRLTESQLHNVIKESVKNILKEQNEEYSRLSDVCNRIKDIALELNNCMLDLYNVGYSLKEINPERAKKVMIARGKLIDLFNDTHSVAEELRTTYETPHEDGEIYADLDNHEDSDSFGKRIIGKNFNYDDKDYSL